MGNLLCEGKDVVKNVAARAKLMSELEKRHVSRFSAGGLTTPWSHPEIGSIHILRGLLKNGRFEATGAEASALAERILNKECPVSATLTEDDKASLRAFQNAVEQLRAEK